MKKKKKSFTNAKEALENQDIEMFKAGSHKCSDGRVLNYSVEDLDSFIAKSNPAKVANVIHHPSLTSYSLANFEYFKRVNDTLYGRLKDVDSSFAIGVEAGLFPERSIRIAKDGTIEHLGWLPKGVRPAVEGLKAVDFASVSVDGVEFFEFYQDNKSINFEYNEEGPFMDQKEIQAMVAENAKLKAENEAFKGVKADFEAEKTAKETLTAENAKLKEENKTLKSEADKVKVASFSAAIEAKIKSITVKEKKSEVKATLTKMASKFDSVQDFSEALELMSFDSKVVVVEGEEDVTNTDFSKVDNKVLGADFEALIEDPVKAEKFQKVNPKKYEAMENAFLGQ